MSTYSVRQDFRAEVSHYLRSWGYNRACCLARISGALATWPDLAPTKMSRQVMGRVLAMRQLSATIEKIEADPGNF